MKKDEQYNDPELKKEYKKYEEKNFDSLVQQVDYEYNLSWLSQYDKLQQILTRLKLYNNQRKDKDAVGDLTMFTTHQTVLASLYEDRLTSTFIGREKGDEEKADNQTSLAEFDYVKMKKNILDYIWDWDTLFFGRGFVEMLEFDRDKEFMCPVPYDVDPAAFLHDYRANSVNGLLRGKGAMRFGGYELYLNKADLTEENGYFNTKWLRSDNELKSLLEQAQRARNEAQNVNEIFNKDVENKLGDNAELAGLKWFTKWKGKRCMVVVAQKRTRLIKYKELEYQGAWPIIDRPMYPTTRDWWGTSIPDLTEDKQRQKSVMINLGIQATKSDMYPHYLYDEDRIKNKADLTKFAFNKFTGVSNNDGKGVQSAVLPLNKANINWSMVNFVLNTLDASVQKATATPDMQTGSIENQDRTLGELNLVAQKVDIRYSLSAKVFGWSEMEFWRQWYLRYKENFADKVDEKVVRISGVQGYSYLPLMREHFITNMDPDIEIESKNVSEAKRMRERTLFQSFGQVVYSDPTANKRFYNKELAKLNGLSKDKIDLLFPPTIDELIARKENETLNKNQLVQVNPNDDHPAHLLEHDKAEETMAKKAHIEAHHAAMRIQRDQPELFPQLQQKQAEEQALAQNGGEQVRPTEQPSLQPSQLPAPAM